MVTDYSPHSPTPSLSSPWASVVRGDPDLISSPPAASPPPPPEEILASAPEISSSAAEAQPDSSDDSNAGRSIRTVWSTPLNAVVEAGSVMGGDVSWPALTEATRPGPRPSSDSTLPVSDGSVSSSQPPVISQPPQRQANSHVHAHANPNASNTVSPRPRSRNRGGVNSSGSRPSYNSFIRPPPMTPPPFPFAELPYGMVPTMIDNSLRATRPVGGGVGSSYSHIGNDHSSQRNNSRRNNYGPRPRGDGPYNNNHGVHNPPPPPYVPGYMPPPPIYAGAAPFMAPHMRGFPGPVGFEMGSHLFYAPPMPEHFRPIVSPPIVSENPIVKQIDYYFSNDNLVKDTFLRSKMDVHGWVPINIIASFPKVQLLTKNINVILDALIHSANVEIQDGKIRKRHGWEKWILNRQFSLNTNDNSKKEGQIETSY